MNWEFSVQLLSPSFFFFFFLKLVGDFEGVGKSAVGFFFLTDKENLFWGQGVPLFGTVMNCLVGLVGPSRDTPSSSCFLLEPGILPVSHCFVTSLGL